MIQGRRKIAVAAAGLLATVLAAGFGYRLLLADPADSDEPLTPPTVSNVAAKAVLPADFPAEDVEMFGRVFSMWDENGDRVIQYRGDFRMDFARRRMASDDAVIWIRNEIRDGQSVKLFTVYLEGNVRIWEIGGTIVSSPRQVVTFQTTGKLWTDSNARGEAAGANNALFRRAKLYRDRAATATGPEDLMLDDQPVPVATQPDATPPPPVTYRADRISPMVRGEERIVVATGNVYISQADETAPAKGKLFMEIEADRAVIFAKEAKIKESMSATSRPEWFETVSGAYMEGAVVLRQGARQIKSSRLYYDFEHERALILDAVIFQPHPSRNVPMIVRAQRIRQLSGNLLDRNGDLPEEAEFLAYDARITTSEMHTPQYALHAREVYLRGARGEDGNATLYYRTKDERFEIRNTPIAWLPGSEGTFDQQETAIRRVRAGADSELGVYGEIEFDLFKLFNQKKWPGVDATLTTAFYGKRGPSVTAETEYRKEDFFGLGLAQGVLDRGGEESLYLEDGDENDDDDDDDEQSRGRGRVLWRHHHFLKNGWEWIAEMSWLSDCTFLQEWYEPEFDTGKEQETLFYLKKAWNNNAFTMLLKPRINAFLNQAEKFPEIKYYKLGEPLWNDRLVYFSENSAGLFNYAVDEDRPDQQDSGILGRLDTRHEFQIPFQAGPVKIVPYVSIRLTDWTKGIDSVLTGEGDILNEDLEAPFADDDDSSGGGGLRMLLTGGVNASTIFSRIFNDVESPFWDVHRLRHIVQPMVNFHLASSSVERNELVPLDPAVEGAHGAGAVNLGLYQRLQTKRGGPGNWRNVDWMRLDLDFTLFFNDPTRTWFEPEFTCRPSYLPDKMDDVFARGEFFYYRPENSLARSTFNWNYEWRASDTFTVLADGNLGEGGLDRASLGVAIQRTPRWRMYFGNRYNRVYDSNDLIFQTHYKIDRKYDFLFSYAFDTIAGEMASTQVTLIRKLQRFYVALTFDVSKVQDRQMVMISVWPEGAPEITLGSRTYSTYGTTTSSAKPW